MLGHFCVLKNAPAFVFLENLGQHFFLRFTLEGLENTQCSRKRKHYLNRKEQMTLITLSLKLIDQNTKPTLVNFNNISQGMR